MLDTRGRGGPEKGEDGALLGASSASPRLQLPLSVANGCLRHRTGSRSVPSSGRWRASHPVHQQKADPGRKELRHRGEGSSGHQVGGPGAALLPPGPEVHPRYGPRTPPMDGPGEGHKRQGDAMVPRAPGLPLWGATSGRSGPLQRGRPLPDLVSFRRSVGGHSPPTPSITPTNTILFRQARTTLRGGGVWRASRVHISVALEIHEEHLFTAHHGLIGHTCGSSACRLLSSMLTETRREASPWDRNLTLSLSPVPDSSVWPTSTTTSTARTHPHLDTIENTATSPYGITTHTLEHGLIKSTLRGFWFELSLSRVPFHPVTICMWVCVYLYTHRPLY